MAEIYPRVAEIYPRVADICPRVADILICPREADICPRVADTCTRRTMSAENYFDENFFGFSPRRTFYVRGGHLADIGQNSFGGLWRTFFWRTVRELMADPIGSDRIRRGLWRTFCVRIKSA